MESENFDELKKLLELKKHEQPPPGYFNGFPDKVIARIKAGEQARPAGWWQRLTGLQPLLAGAYGLAVVGMLVFAVTSLTKTPTNQAGQTGAPVAKSPSMPVTHPEVNENIASVPLAVPPNINANIASNDTAPPFLFNPNGVFDSNSPVAPQTAPVEFKPNGD